MRSVSEIVAAVADFQKKDAAYLELHRADPNSGACVRAYDDRCCALETADEMVSDLLEAYPGILLTALRAYREQAG